MKYYYLIIALVITALSSCGDSKEVYLQNLQELRTNLQQTNDTVYAYSLDHHFAIWLHQETIGEDMYDYEEVQTLYHYDLKSKVQTKLFTAKEDTLTLKNKGVPFVIKQINHLSITPDSMAVLIGDAYLLWDDWGRRSKIYMLPLAEKNSLIELCFEEELDEISFDVINGASIPNLPRWIGNGYVAEKNIELPTIWTGETTWKQASRLYVYTTGGEEKPLILNQSILNKETGILENQETCVSDKAYCQSENGQWYEIPANILEDAVELRKHYVFAHMYQIEDVFKIAKNEVMFDNTFGKKGGNSPSYFELTLKSIQKSRENPNNYIIIGDGFAMMTDEKQFAQLNYPHKVIIEGYVSDVERAKRLLRSNPLATYYLGGLMALGAMTPNGSAAMQDMQVMDERFEFTNVKLLYY